MESEIQKLNSILEAVLNSSTSGILAKRSIRDEQNRIVDFEYISVNKAAENMLELEPGSLKGKKMLSEFPSIEVGEFRKYVEVVEKGITLQYEFFNKDLNRWYEVVCVKMMDGLVTTFSNITEKKRAVDMLRKGYEELKVTATKLKASNQELEKSNFDLMQFASVASHDLKEPLRKIQTYGNLFKEKVNGKLGEKEEVYLDKVINSAHRMQVLVDDILTLSKLSNDTAVKEATDLSQIVREIIDDLEITIEEKKAQITIGQLPVVEAVPGQMHQLFLNLLVNALKFCNDRPCIRIFETRLTSDLVDQYKLNSHSCCIVVEDDGIGFEEKYANKIFGIFQRLNGANFQGTGIGLSICKKIVENHGGHISVQSKPGQGSRFFVMIPFRQMEV